MLSNGVGHKPCAVQGKISCILKTVVRERSSAKRPGQNYFIEATNELSTEALACDLSTAIATEKLDGTCCHVREHYGRLMLWARLDRKPNKGAEKRFKTFQRKHREWELNQNGAEPIFTWKFPDDLKPVAEDWIPADDVEVDESSGCPIPDKNGHVPGWVPVDQTNSQYCWHSSVVDYNLAVAVTLRPVCSSKMDFVISLTPLQDLEGKTLELIGTSINGNPYSFGSKGKPFHVLVEHGCLQVPNIPQPLTAASIQDWFVSSEYCKIEGIVWHLQDGKMFKLHRHHLKLPWPLAKRDSDTSSLPLLSHRPVKFATNDFSLGNHSPKSMLSTVSLLNGKTFKNIFDAFQEAEIK